MTRKEFERSFDRAFERAFTEADLPGSRAALPDSLPSWHNLQRPLRRLRRQNTLRRVTARGGIAAAALLLGAALFGTTNAAKAVQPFYQSVRAYSGDVYGFFFGRGGEAGTDHAKTSAPTEDGQSATGQAQRREIMSVEEARLKLSFDPPSFAYLPSGVTVRDVQLYFTGNEKRADYAAYRLRNVSGQYAYVSFHRLRSETATNLQSVSDGSGIRKIEINGQPAFVKHAEDGSVSLQTFRNRILVQISGNMKEEEAVKIVQNLHSGRE